MFIMELSEKLQELRKEKGLTQEELAEALFVSRTAISKWESGRGVPNIESLKAISKFFSVSIDELLSGEEKWIPVWYHFYWHIHLCKHQEMRTHISWVSSNQDFHEWD